MGKLDINKMTSVIKEQIRSFKEDTKLESIGTVLTVGDGIATVYGLQNALMGELLEFPHDVKGLVFNLEAHQVGVIILGKSDLIKEGDFVKQTKKIFEVPVGDVMLGRVINPLGEALDGKGIINAKEFYPIERPAKGIMARGNVSEPLQTGIKMIDALIPIGKGQRELIIGDRQTGKTTIAADTILNQKGKDVICIYVAIGQKDSTIANMVSNFEVRGAMDYTIIINASASRGGTLLYIAPFAGVSIAEYFMEKGKDVLIIYDDLSKHAVAYRELSLLLRRPPGREAYPGDIFYLHSRLLERAAKIKEELGGGSITALPVIETQAGDISAYIPTNVISITDGQIYLESQLFHSGIRPAINAGLSVSRVGGSAQWKAMKKVSGSLRINLANYRELESFAQFGSDLDNNAKKRLDRGKKTVEILKQDVNEPVAFTEQIINLYALSNGYLDDVKLENIEEFQNEVRQNLTASETGIKIKKYLSDNHDLPEQSLIDEFLKGVKKYI